jgi:adenylate cyclase
VNSDPGSDIAALKRWLIEQALLGASVPRVAEGFADRIAAAGLPIWRAHAAFSTLHPQVESVGLTWTREGKRQFEEFGHGSFDRLVNASPFYDAVAAAQALARAMPDGAAGIGTPMTRYRLERGDGPDKYEILAEFRAAGGTDYVCFVIVFGSGGRYDAFASGAAVSLTTDRAGGFTDAEIAVLVDVMPAFGAALRVGAGVATTRNLLDTYLGRDVGARVLSGEIRRGSVEAISAAIVVGDLRRFTSLADEMSHDALVAMLDDYLDCLTGPIEAGGGQVLKFLGDGLLATFGFTSGEQQAFCMRALTAASEALDRVEALNRRRRDAGLPVTTFDLALHAGEVMYGNVGSDRRLDFTIIGPAVNEAARLEALCSTLGVPLVASGHFVELIGTPARFRSLGPHTLRGVRAPVEVFTLA